MVPIGQSMTKLNARPAKIRVCLGKTCGPLGGEEILDKLERHYGLRAGQANDQVDLDHCACRSFCELGPTVDVDEKTITHASPSTIAERIERGDGRVIPREPDEAELDAILSDLL